MPHITVMDTNAQAVLVTGAGKGIGEAVAERLSELGYLVFAGVRQNADIERYRAHQSGNIHPVHLEVTNETSIRSTAHEIKSVLGDRVLFGLVNNAGIALAGPLEFLPINELRRQLEVNVVGQIAVTQAVLPLLRQSRGRIVNIGSIAGRSAMPMVGAYAASKFAMEALTDSLRVELIPAGIDVIIVEPGVIATPIWETSIKSGEAIMDQLPPEAFQYYGRIITAAKERAAGASRIGLPARKVAAVVLHALTARKPKTRYVVGRDARIRMLLQSLPDRWRDRLIARKLAKL
jgi:NAD(P)-dependent dehydrogenase (short-subunit alcohol dehydrogenase family)